MSASGDGGRWHAVDHVKAAAIVAVVFTHAGRVTLGGSGGNADFLLTSLWTRFHVPSFLFVSGFLYARSSGVAWRTIGLRLRRVLLPYGLASLVAVGVGLAVASQTPPWIRWPVPVHDFADVGWQLATASALGVYYYVLLIVCCIPLLWPLSRSGRWGPWALCLALAALAVAVDTGLVTRSSQFLADWWGHGVVFWVMRNPVEQFHAGYFVAGWLAALHLPQLARFAAERRSLAVAICTAGVGFGWLSFSGLLSSGSPAADRVVYSLTVVGLLAIVTHRIAAGPVVRFLGDTSLGIYLFHRIFQLLAQPVTDPWPPLARIGAQVAVGLAGAGLVMAAGRQLLGEARARQWLGA